VKLGDKVCLLTGATSGIGAATARLFAQEGAILALTGRNEARGLGVLGDCRRLGSQESSFVAADIVDPAAVEQVVDDAAGRYGRIDVLFNNAGIIDSGTVDEIAIDRFEKVISVNLLGQFYYAHFVLPHMRRQRSGVIVNMASDWALVGGRGAAAYCASKAAILMMSKCIALDHAREGIRCNAVCPGDTLTPMHDVRADLDDHEAEEQAEIYSSVLPMGRMAEPREVASAVLFLASEDSSFVTGIGLPVDGGFTCQ